jgi:hypothetical protein
VEFRLTREVRWTWLAVEDRRLLPLLRSKTINSGLIRRRINRRK